MARIAGVDLPGKKRIETALTYIYGIGLTLSKKVLAATRINPDVRVKDLSDSQVNALKNNIESSYKVEGDLRRDKAMNIKRLMAIGSFRGSRHKKNLPVRGQRTHTNARTRKGPRRAIIANKKTV